MDRFTRRLKLRHVRLIHAIAETGQISIAANRLSITQPAASRTLAEVERLVGEPLFARHAKGMLPTPIGEVVIRHAGTLIGDLGNVGHDVEAFRQGRAGTVRIGAVNGPAARYVVPAVRRLKEDAEAEISVDVAPSVELMAGLIRGDYDLVMCRVPHDVDPRPLEIRRGRIEEIRILTRLGHPLLERRGLSLADLAGLCWVIQRTGMPIRQAVEQAFINRDIPVPRDTVDTASLLVALSYLRGTDAVAAVTKEVIELLDVPGTASWGVLELREAIILTPYHLIRIRDRPVTPICRRLIGLIEEEMGR